MVSISWCSKQKNGIRRIEPNPNMSDSYISLAEASIGTMNREKDKNIVFSVAAGYYSMYYSLYSILMRIGVKCEIHKCTIKFMENFLNSYFSKEDVKIIYNAFKLRNNMQYYVDKVVDNTEIEKLMKNAPDFFAKCKEVIASFNEDDIKRIRNSLK